jgi:ABC-type antimicrobial peptide transport system permease subunit
MQALFDTHTKDQIVEAEEKQNVKIKIDLALQSLTDIHLGKPGPDNGMIDGSDSSYSYTLSGIALFILIIACINFINLAVSQSMKRAKEIGIRKVVGGSRAQLIRQFLVESFIIICIAFGIALLLTVVLIPSFNTLADKKLNLEYLSDAYLFVGFGILLLVTTFLAGIYPSLVLSSPQPIKVLYGRHKLMGKNYITRSLIVVQFALAIFLVINTLVINAQMNFLYQANLGYDSRNLVRVNIPVSKTSDLLPTQFKNELLGNKNIVSVAARHGGRSISGVMVNGKMIEIENNKIDDQFLATFKIPIIVGRNFSPDFPSDSLHGVIVNEAFLKEAGWRLDESVGKTINFLATGKQPAAIVGIIKDYHFVSLKEKIKPALFSMNPDFNFGQIWIRVNPDDIPETLTLIEKTFKKLVPYYPYTYQFMDDLNAANYKAETKSKHILMISSGLFIFISCIGLFGLVILSIEQRTKEIGIRKVLGAAVTRVAGLISKQFVILIGIAFVVSVPLAYMTLDKWLNKFAYHVDMPWWLFAIAGSSTIGLSLLIIGVQSIKAALANPVDSLRSE